MPLFYLNLFILIQPIISSDLILLKVYLKHLQILLPRIHKTYKQKTQTLYFSKHHNTLPPLAPGPHNLIHLPPGKCASCIFGRFSLKMYTSTRFTCSLSTIPQASLPLFSSPAFHLPNWEGGCGEQQQESSSRSYPAAKLQAS